MRHSQLGRQSRRSCLPESTMRRSNSCKIPAGTPARSAPGSEDAWEMGSAEGWATGSAAVSDALMALGSGAASARTSAHALAWASEYMTETASAPASAPASACSSAYTHRSLLLPRTRDHNSHRDCSSERSTQLHKLRRRPWSRRIHLCQGCNRTCRDRRASATTTALASGAASATAWGAT